MHSRDGCYTERRINYMADDTLARMMAAQAARSARAGKSLYSNPVVNAIAGWKPTSLGGQRLAQAQPQEQARLRPVQSSKSPGKSAEQAIQDKLLARFRTVEETGFGVPAEGMIPGAAFRPEVQELFGGAGGISVFNPRDMSPEEMQGLQRLLDPRWVASQNDPGANLTEAEKAEALASSR